MDRNLNLRVSGVGCPAYALLSYGVASRCQVSGKRNREYSSQ